MRDSTIERAVPPGAVSTGGPPDMETDLPSRLFDRVLCAVALDHRSAAPLYNAAALATPGGAVHAVHVADTADGEATRAAGEAALRSYIRRHLPLEAPYMPRVTSELRFGHHAHTLLEASRHAQWDLIVIGTRGHTGVREHWIGSTARELLRTTLVPVMVIPPVGTELAALEASAAHFHVGRILVAVDPSRIVVDQLRLARRLRATSRDPLCVIHVEVPDGPAAILSRALAELPADTEVRTVRGRSVAQGILDAAGDGEVGVILMGLDPAEATMTPGAIAYEVVRQSSAAVLAVPSGGLRQA